MTNNNLTDEQLESLHGALFDEWGIHRRNGEGGEETYFAIQCEEVMSVIRELQQCRKAVGGSEVAEIKEPPHSTILGTATCNITLQQCSDGINRINVKIGPVPVGSLRSKKLSEPRFVNELLAIEDIRELAIIDTPLGKLSYHHINLHDLMPASREVINLGPDNAYPFSETIRKAMPVLQEFLEHSVIGFTSEIRNSGGANN